MLINNDEFASKADCIIIVIIRICLLVQLFADGTHIRTLIHSYMNTGPGGVLNRCPSENTPSMEGSEGALENTAPQSRRPPFLDHPSFSLRDLTFRKWILLCSLFQSLSLTCFPAGSWRGVAKNTPTKWEKTTILPECSERTKLSKITHFLEHFSHLLPPLAFIDGIRQQTTQNMLKKCKTMFL